MPTSLFGSTPSTRMPASRTTWSPSLDGASSPYLRMADPTANPLVLLLLADLGDLRRLHLASVHAADAILDGESVDCAELNALAAGSSAHIELVVTDGVPRRHLIWTDTSLSAALARRLIEELNALEPDRFRRCARPECDLLFYDTTRSRTRRWHAEDPCGWRERQRVHRLRTSS